MWALRDYGSSVETIWDEKEDCGHEFIIEKTSRPNASGGKDNPFAEKLRIKGVENYSEYVNYNDRATYSNFCSKCNAWKGQLGLEPTFNLYIKHLCNIFDEVKRVLKKTGTCWINIGDCYAGNMGKKSGWTDNKLGFEKQEAIDKGVTLTNKTKIIHELPQKCLVQIPARFSIEMSNRGWILRNDIVWYKRNSMPSSVKDRFANKWEHVFLFVKNKKYYFDLDAVRKQISSDYNPFNRRVRDVILGKIASHQYRASEEEKIQYNEKYNQLNDKAYQRKVLGIEHDSANVHPLGGNPGDFWDITTQPHPFAHFACYPEKLCETPIKSSCPEFVCNKCGKPREKIIETISGKGQGKSYNGNRPDGWIFNGRNRKSEYNFKGLSNDSCNVGFSPGIVLDPFAGSGTTCLVTRKLNRNFIGFELNPAYIEIANERLKPYLEQKTIMETLK